MTDIERLKERFLKADRNLERAVEQYLARQISWEDYDLRLQSWMESHDLLRAALRKGRVREEPYDLLDRRKPRRPARAGKARHAEPRG